MKIDRRAIAAVIAFAFLSTSCVLTGSALAGFTASIKNTSDTVGSGTDFLTATNGSVQCTSVPTGSTVPSTSSFPCTGNQLPASVATTGNSTGAVVLSATGTSSFTSATYRAALCGPVQLANSATSSDPMVVRGGVTFAGTGPTTLSGSGSFGVDGSTGMAVDVTSANGLQTFSEGIWFKTSSAAGALMGYSSSPSNTSASTFDRHLYLNAAGNVVFGVYMAGVDTVQSPSTYANGAWHFALATLTSNTGLLNAQAIQTLYVDGVQVATTTRTTGGNGAESTTGYWRVGESRTSVADGWTGNGEFFAGSLSDAMVFPAALTGAQVSALYASTSQTAYAALVSTDGAQHFWPLNDNGLQTFAGPYPVLGATSPCTQVRATVGTSTKCVYPASASPCPAQSSTNLLSGLVAAVTLALTPSTPSTSQTLTTTVSEDTSYNTGYDQGLHLLVPVTITETPFSQSFTWSTNATVI
jgi:Concanavalin A-like lectin/glucanases superfamily